LLLLRLVVGILLIHDGVLALTSGAQAEIAIVQSVAIAAGILLVVGLWTPIAGLLLLLVDVCLVLLRNTEIRSGILLGVVGVALGFLGPGHRSLDALRYGRRRLVIPPQ
jgi:putative oxidoreductase